jgi:hypothetical protein
MGPMIHKPFTKIVRSSKMSTQRLIRTMNFLYRLHGEEAMEKFIKDRRNAVRSFAIEGMDEGVQQTLLPKSFGEILKTYALGFFPAEREENMSQDNVAEVDIDLSSLLKH